MEEKQIKSLTEYIALVIETNTNVKSDCFHNLKLLFRGQSEVEMPLLPTLGRGRPCIADHSVFNNERNLIEMAKFKLPEIFRQDFEPIELLALLQHYGIPTRLLDVTENPLVALYFSCISKPDKDGEVFVFHEEYNNIANFPIINGLAESYKFSGSTCGTDLALFYGAIKNQPYFIEQKQTNEICHKTDYVGGKWVAECCKNPLFIYAPIKSERQRAQQGRYILFPNEIEEQGAEKRKAFVWKIDPIERDNECISYIIKIPKECKVQILKDLDLVGINEATLFPDNIDKICHNIVNDFK